MKHLGRISKGAPASADTWQDVVCIIVNTMNALLEAFGTASPFGEALRTKCEIPTAND